MHQNLQSLSNQNSLPKYFYFLYRGAVLLLLYEDNKVLKLFDITILLVLTMGLFPDIFFVSMYVNHLNNMKNTLRCKLLIQSKSNLILFLLNNSDDVRMFESREKLYLIIIYITVISYFFHSKEFVSDRILNKEDRTCLTLSNFSDSFVTIFHNDLYKFINEGAILLFKTLWWDNLIKWNIFISNLYLYYVFKIN